MSSAITRPVRGGLAIVILALVIGGALLTLSFAPGGWEKLPIVLWFRRLSFFEFAGVIAAPVILTVAVLAALDARRPDTPGVPKPLRWRLWTTRRFAIALLLPPPIILVGARLLNGCDGILVGPAWTYIYFTAVVLVGGIWLATAFHSFRDWRRCAFWILAGLGIVGSVIAIPPPLGFYFEIDRARSPAGFEVLHLSRTDQSGGFEGRGVVKLARVRWERFGLTRYDDLVESEWIWTDYGESGPNGGVLVRPEGYGHEPDDSIFKGYARSALFFSEDGLVALVRGDMECELACDTRTGARYGDWTIPMFPSPGRSMESLSPFRLMWAGGRPSERDVRSLEELAAKRAQGVYISYERGEAIDLALREKWMLAALDAPNELVRQAARRVIRAGGETLYPEAYDRVR